MKQITPPQLAEWLKDDSRPAPFLLDVREPQEFQYCSIPGSVLMPMASVPARMQELEPDAEIVVICHHGGRSMQVAMFLQHQGFANLINLAGGVAQWAAQVDPAMPQY
ncbi:MULTISPECIES: rhodanese-like domain-containing protein [Zoogloea]|jgi:rhodanese-related sulfurtransferase|uniref:Sulfurtransferase n=1 Tax=Zoogloea oleivorans TaxID=1552750 RepID=A0A6C2D692_9RHOO|nr:MULTISPECIES: rhodanese-like domain-containing protein [Zoogloea]MBP8132638.1 sulfurtransferase [Zoogloea sp.]MBT9496823.1 sulfurtransferase [Zoogloea sp.]MDD2668424.1 rhodanese-like domain-containing protein [Zoogloea sp.]TYC61105.1 sulfurtransferase [Zoogloea oleivorans]